MELELFVDLFPDVGETEEPIESGTERQGSLRSFGRDHDFHGARRALPPFDLSGESLGPRRSQGVELGTAPGVVAAPLGGE